MASLTLGGDWVFCDSDARAHTQPSYGLIPSIASTIYQLLLASCSVFTAIKDRKQKTQVRGSGMSFILVRLV